MPPDQASLSLPCYTLSEEVSKAILAPFGVPFPAEALVTSARDAGEAALKIGLPVVAKLNGDQIAHKTERGLVRLGLGSVSAVEQAAAELLSAATEADGDVGVLIAPMIKSNREFICGASIDPQFGPTVLLGVGGILAEAIADVVIRLVPIDHAEALSMIDELSTQELLGEFRGEEEVDRSAMASILLALSDTMQARPEIEAIDLNPILISQGQPVAVDALVQTCGAGR